MNHYLKISRITPHPESGKNTVITQVGLYTPNGDWIKWVSPHRLERIIKEAQIEVTDAEAKNMIG